MSGLDEVMRNLEKWQAQTLDKARRVMEEIANHLAEYAKADHPWENQTGESQGSIRGFVEEAGPGIITATLSAGAGYDVFLELAKDGRWAWLWPAVEANMDEIKRKLDSVVEV